MRICLLLVCLVGPAAPLGSSKYLPTPDAPIGWRGDGSGRYPGATPPTSWERRKSGNGYATKAAPLPRSLKDATELLRQSRRAREILGDGFVDHYLRTREWEVRQFERAVTTWELERYLELI